jgi:hypothetical protein
LRVKATMPADGRPERGDRCEVDDPAAFTLLDHHPSRCLGAEPGSFQVHVDDGAPRLLIQLQHRAAREDAGVVDQDIDSVQLRNSGVNHRLHPGRLRDVNTEAERPAAIRLNLARGGGGVLWQHVAHHDGRAGRRQSARQRLADPLPRTRDHRNLAAQLSWHVLGPPRSLSV